MVTQTRNTALQVVRALLASALLWTLAPTAVHAQGAGSDYRIVVKNVDSSKFPRIRIEFQVLPTRPDVRAWKPPAPIDVAEEVLDQAQAIDPQNVEVEPEPCHEDPVVLGVAVDTSGSVGGVMQEIKDGVQAVFEYLETSQTDDRAAIRTFDSNRKFRFPEEGAGETYTKDGSSLANSQEFKDIQGGGFSPIWEGLDAELGELLAFDHPDPNAKRVLVAMTDGKNNRQPDKAQPLTNKAILGGANIITLGYGDVDPLLLEMISSSSGGTHMEGIEGNVENALFELLNSIRYTWCLEYDSPHGDVVNEPATVTVETGGAKGSARFPLPFLIPEDTPAPELFFPVGYFTFLTIYASGELPPVNVSMELRDAAGNPWAPRTPGLTPDRPEEVKELEFQVSPDSWVGDQDGAPDGEYGFLLKAEDAGAVWEELYKIPTDYVNVNRDVPPGEQLIDGVDHYLVKAELDLSSVGFAPGAGRKFPTATRLSVQDRTPPSVRMKLSPQDGRAVLELEVREQVFHQDPALVQGRPNSQVVRERGTGQKTAWVRYTWRDEDGDRIEGTLEQQQWSLWVDTDGDGALDSPTFEDSGTAAITDPRNHILARGVQVPTGTRVQLEVVARDNIERLEESIAPEDREALTEANPDPVEGPLYSRMDLTRPEAQVGSNEAPFLAPVERGELEADLSKSGVSWWIESPHDDRDRFAGIEWPGEFMYAYSDRELRENLASAGATAPDGEPLRKLRLRAQDGRGNVTMIDLPLIVGDAGFDTRTLEYESRRDARLR